MKYHPHGSVLFVTFTLEEGLLLLCNPLCEAIIKSCLARAQYKHPIKISGFVVEGTHIHMLIVVDNPSDVPGFMRCFKVESAHMLNRILGRKKRTIWCESYDDPIVLTLPRAMLAMCYIYSNPSKDNLEESIDRYPGVTSWKMLLKGENRKSWPRLKRSFFRHIPQDARNFQGFKREALRVQAQSTNSHDFVLDPNAWLIAYGVSTTKEQDHINAKIIQRVRTLEMRYLEIRKRNNHRVLGAKKLMNQSFDLSYSSKRSGKRMWCLSENRKLRISFINYLKDLFERARVISAKWLLGDFSSPYPLGLYPPSMPKLGEPLQAW
jgi:REP element-mobilizing transposase RayT